MVDAGKRQLQMQTTFAIFSGVVLQTIQPMNGHPIEKHRSEKWKKWKRHKRVRKRRVEWSRDTHCSLAKKGSILVKMSPWRFVSGIQFRLFSSTLCCLVAFSSLFYFSFFLSLSPFYCTLHRTRMPTAMELKIYKKRPNQKQNFRKRERENKSVERTKLRKATQGERETNRTHGRHYCL